MQKKINIFFINLLYLALLIIAIIMAFLAWQWRSFQTQPLLVTAPTRIILKPGIKIEALAEQLQQQGIIDHPHFFIWWAIIQGENKKLKAGEYAVTGEMTAPQLLKNIVQGKIVLWRITFPEGWTFKQMLASLEKNPYLMHTVVGLDEKAIMQKLGYNQVNPEGLFFPDTYLFSRGTQDTVILHKAYERMQQKLGFAWERRAPDLPYKNAYEALTVASMVEREAKLTEERTQIAGVIIRRLQKNMLLQIDPTVTYGLGKPYGTRLSKTELRTPTPYNTYLHTGLPPTPISMPGSASLWAAVHPDDGDSLYFVSNADGSHHFSANLSEHNKAVVNYRKKKAAEEKSIPPHLNSTAAVNYLQQSMPVFIPYPVCKY